MHKDQLIYSDTSRPLTERLEAVASRCKEHGLDKAADVIMQAREALAGAEKTQDDLRRRLRKAESDASYHC